MPEYKLPKSVFHLDVRFSVTIYFMSVDGRRRW